MKNEMAGAGRKYGVMLVTWLAFGWSRPAFSADPIVPGEMVTPSLAASDYSDNSVQPLRLKLSQAVGASRATAKVITASRKGTAAARGEGVQPLRLKLSEIMSALPAVAEIATEPAKVTVPDQGEKVQPSRLKLAEVMGASPAAASTEVSTAAREKDTQPLRLKLAQEIGASPAVVKAPPTAASIAAAPVEDSAAQPEGKQAPRLQFAPVEYGIGGDVGYNLQRQTNGTDKTSAKALTANVRGVANSFIWQPWFAQVKGGLGLGFTQNSASSNKSSSNSVTGDAALSLLPSSRFPFGAHFARNNNYQNLDIGVGSSYQSTNFGLTQRYRPLVGNAQYAVSYDHDIWKSTSQYEDKQDQFKLDMTHQINEHSFKVSGDSTRNVRSSTNDSTWTNMLTATHNYRPDPVLSVETLANLIQTNYRLTGGETDLRYTQLTSSAFWRPTEKPLTVNGSVRVFGLVSESSLNSAGASRSTTANANLGANYEMTKHLRLNGGANINITETGGSQLVSTSQNVGATYQPDGITFGKYSYTRSVSGGLSNTSGDAGSEQNLTLSPSHGLNRSSDLGGGRLGLNLTQSVAADARSHGTSTMNLSHSGSAGWSVSGDRNTTMLRLSASDSRAVVGTEYFMQLVNAQATLDQSFSRYSSWNGNLTLQAVRQGTGTDPAKTTTTTNADMSYRHQRVFNVPRLRFTSDLRATGDAYIPVLATPDQQASLSWENRLDYSIGRTQVRLSARVAEVNKVKQSLLWFSLTRQF